MKQQRPFDSSSFRDGVVLVFPPGVSGLFNPTVHRLVKEVEDQLEGVYVTYALSGGNGPDVEAATQAARFAGCDSAVVIYSNDISPEGSWIDPTSDTLWTDERRQAGLQETVEWVVKAYNHIRGASGIAA